MAGRKTPAAFWVCCFILFIPVLGLCVYQIYDRIAYYMSYPTTQDTREVMAESQLFPSVTVCNNNPVRKTALSGTSYASLLDSEDQVRQSVENLLSTADIDPVNPSVVREILNTAYQDRRTARAPDDLTGMTREDIANLGQQLTDFVMSCSYNGQQCVSSDLSSVFATFQSTNYGNCFTFNGGFEVSKGQGLTMTLFTDVAEYVGLFGRQAGVTVTVHPTNTTAFPEDNGIPVKAGESAAIGLKKAVKKRLPAPYGNCADGSNRMETLYSSGYTTAMCWQNCLQKAILQSCGCVDDPRTISGDICSAANTSQENCRLRYHEQSATWRDNCHCTPSCTEESYVTTVTSSPWAPENVLIPALNYVTPPSDVGSLIQQNVVQIKVSYLDNTYVQVEQRVACTVKDLFRDVGLDIAVWAVIFLILIGLVYLVVIAIRACCGKRESKVI